MNKLEEAINAIQNAINRAESANASGALMQKADLQNILELLKAQEPVSPKVKIDTYVCGACGTRLERQSLIGSNAVLAETFNYCPECGRKVKWE